MKRIICLAGCAVIILAACGMVLAADYWAYLGQRTVNHHVDHDTIVVGGSEGEFKAIQIAVLRNAVRFMDVKVHFANGGVQDISLRSLIPAGKRSRAIDLAGDDRRIQKIEFWYDTQSIFRRKAIVRVYGLKTGSGR